MGEKLWQVQMSRWSMHNAHRWVR